MYAINTYGYPPKIEDCYKALQAEADLGFRYVEVEGIREANMLELAENAESLKEAADALGLEIVNVSAILPGIASPDASVRKTNLELFERAVEVASCFGSETILTDSYAAPMEFIGGSPYQDAMTYSQHYRVKVDPSFQWQRAWDTVVDSLARCYEVAKRAGIKVVVEPRVGEIISNSDALLRLFEQVDDPNLGAVLDAAHLHAAKEILPLSIEKLRDRIFTVHVSDNDGSTNRHLPVGDGTVDWEGVFTALKKHGFQGQAAVDIEAVPQMDEAYVAAREFLTDLGRRLSL